jgi:hypothetical protein
MLWYWIKMQGDEYPGRGELLHLCLRFSQALIDTKSVHKKCRPGEDGENEAVQIIIKTGIP